MPESQFQRAYAEHIINQVQTSTWTRQGGKRIGSNTVIVRLGHDESGQHQSLIATDVEGKRERYRTIRLPGGDPKSSGFPVNRATVYTHADQSIANYYHSWSSELNIAELADTGTDSGTFLDRLSAATDKSRLLLVCDAEALHFDGAQRDRLSHLLWEFIVENRDSNHPDVLVAVGSAIRKYVAMLNFSRMTEMAGLLEDGHRAPLSLVLRHSLILG